MPRNLTMPICLDQAALDDLQVQARQAPRRRAHRLLHQSPADAVQRMAVAMLPDSYVRPHRHVQREKWEWLSVLRGRLVFLLFDEQGRVSARHELTPQGPVFALELPARCWHSVVALESDTVFFEVKQGPFIPLQADDFAGWSPPEGTAAADACLNWMKTAQVGDRYRWQLLDTK